MEDKLNPPCGTAHTSKTTPGNIGGAALIHSRGHLLLCYASASCELHRILPTPPNSSQYKSEIFSTVFVIFRCIKAACCRQSDKMVECDFRHIAPS